MILRFQRISFFVRLIAVSFLFVMTTQTAKALQILEQEKKIVLTGEISKALGTYDEHLQGAVEYLLCGRGGKEYESIIVVNSPAKEIHDAMLKLNVERGTHRYCTHVKILLNFDGLLLLFDYRSQHLFCT